MDKNKDKIYGYNPETNEWHCTTCGVSMGENNPRQLCGKWICLSPVNETTQKKKK